MKKAIVLLSGGQDSTTCLYWAKKKFDEVVAIGFFYGQKHKVEQECASRIASQTDVPFYQFDLRGLLGGSSLTNGPQKDHNQSHQQNANLPASFTAGRNALFLTIAASFAYNLGIRDIVTGVCQTDYSGYPDCRREFIDSMEKTLSFAMDPEYNPQERPVYGMLFKIHTPLMYLTKAETWKMSNDLGVLEVIISKTMTDYNGDTTMNEWGMGVNNNPATKLRVEGFYEAKEKGWLK